jgi:ATP-dependent Clp protease ATP-binding subunit ClpA
MTVRLSAYAQAALAKAQESARSLGRDSLDSDLLLLGLTGSGPAAEALTAQGVSPAALLDQINARWPALAQVSQVGMRPLAAETETIIADAQKIAHHAGAEEVSTGHLLLAMVRLRESLGAQLLWACTADLGALETALED